MTFNSEKTSTHVHCVWIHWASGHPVRGALLLITMTKIVDCAIHVNCIEDIQWKLKTVIPVLKTFVTLTVKFSFVLIVTIVNVINKKLLNMVLLE